MGVSTFLVKLVLPVLAVLGILGCHKLSLDNGLCKMMEVAVVTRTLPGAGLPLRTHWTGLGPFDKAFNAMICFFTPMIDGRHWTLSLQALHFAGQLSAAWMLMCVESFRVGNAWKAISFVTLWGLSAENIGAGFTLPIYFLLHLLTSPTARSPTSMSLRMRKAMLLIHPTDLAVLPWSMAIGSFVPAGMAIYTSLATTTPFWASAQFWIGARLYHPIWTAVAHMLASGVLRSREPVFTSATQRNRDVLRALQAVYTYATFVAVVPHLAVVTVSGAAYLFPHLFTLEAQAAFHPMTLLRPVYFWHREAVYKTPSIGAGAFDFLQWDEFACTVGVLLWAFALNRQCLSKEPSGSSLIGTAVKTTLMFAVGGPVAAAISLVKQRDQIVLDLPDVSDGTSAAPAATSQKKLH